MALLVNETRRTMVARGVQRPHSAWQRAVGLIGRGKLAPDDGLWLEPCRGIHTIGMRTAIDVALLDSDGRIVAVFANVPPLRPAIAHPRATIALELAAGTIARTNLAIGDRLALRAAP